MCASFIYLLLTVLLFAPHRLTLPEKDYTRMSPGDTHDQRSMRGRRWWLAAVHPTRRVGFDSFPSSRSCGSRPVITIRSTHTKHTKYILFLFFSSLAILFLIDNGGIRPDVRQKGQQQQCAMTIEPGRSHPIPPLLSEAQRSPTNSIPNYSHMYTLFRFVAIACALSPSYHRHRNIFRLHMALLGDDRL